ncbi:MAG: LysM peptidoglycan-binding domain-containing protein [Bacteroidia bacterium]|nr:LysM peptidoglycan-binding domain-containing protein [Bacteroidia bacterium]
MKKAMLFAFSLIFALGNSFSQSSVTGQDTIFLQRSDSIFCFSHSIQKGQTLYGLSQQYQISLESVHRLNPKLMETELGIGDTLLIPLNTKLLYNERDIPTENRAPAIYRVQAKETLYTIAKKWARKKVAYLKKINNLSDKTLSLEMPLILGWMDNRLLTNKNFDTEEIEIAQKDAELALKRDTSSQQAAVIEQGKAIWLKSKSSNDQPFVLHRKAKLNSIVQLYNPMTGKRIHAKVVGRISSRNYDDNVLVVLTPYLARALKARDEAFFIKMKYTL